MWIVKWIACAIIFIAGAPFLIVGFVYASAAEAFVVGKDLANDLAEWVMK